MSIQKVLLLVGVLVVITMAWRKYALPWCKQNVPWLASPKIKLPNAAGAAGTFIGKRASGGFFLAVVLLPLVYYVVKVAMGDGPWWKDQFEPATNYFLAAWLAFLVVALLGTRGGGQKREVGHVAIGILFSFVALAFLGYGLYEIAPKEWTEVSASNPKSVNNATRVQPKAQVLVGEIVAPVGSWSPVLSIPSGYRIKASWPGKGTELVEVLIDGKTLYQGGSPDMRFVQFRSKVGESLKVSYSFSPIN